MISITCIFRKNPRSKNRMAKSVIGLLQGRITCLAEHDSGDDAKCDGAYINREMAYYFKKEYRTSWNDFKKAQDLGHQVSGVRKNGLRVNVTH
jgi:hypothetical protein